jgi:hypothetical protein
VPLRKVLPRPALLLVIGLGFAAPARADIEAVFTGARPSGPNTAFTYDIRLTRQRLIVAGDPAEFITVFDVPGYVPGSATFDLNPDLRASLAAALDERAVGATPPGAEVADSPELTNVTVRFDTVPPAGMFGSYGAVSLGALTITSVFPGQDLGGRFAARAFAGTPTGTAPTTNQGLTTVPAGSDVYLVSYVSGSGGTIRLLNPGAFRDPAFPGGPDFDRAPVCANVYVYRPGGQLLACCSCPVTANGARRLNVATNLLSNPLQPPALPPAGITQDAAVKIVASAGAVCSTPDSPTPGEPVSPPTAAGPYAPAPGGLRAWATHVQGAAGSPAAATETRFLSAPLSPGELIALQQQCAFTSFLGTGAGVCTCGQAPHSFFGAEEMPADRP